MIGLRDGLEGVLPGWLIRAGLPPRAVRRVGVEALPLEPAAKAALEIAARGGAAVEVALAPDLFLKRAVPLPAAARRDAAGAVALQMRQSMPGQAEGLIWRHVDAPGEAVDVHVLKEARLTELLRDAGVPLRRVVIDGVAAAPLYDARGVMDRAERFWNRAVPVALAAVLVAVLAGQALVLWQADRAVAEGAARLASLRDEAAAARAAAETRDAEGAARLADARRMARDGRRMALLADLTGALGDEVWATSVLMQDDVLRLSGFVDGDVAQVLAAIKALPWVAEVDLDGSVGLTEGSAERRFQVIITLRAEDAA